MTPGLGIPLDFTVGSSLEKERSSVTCFRDPKKHRWKMFHQPWQEFLNPFFLVGDNQHSRNIKLAAVSLSVRTVGHQMML